VAEKNVQLNLVISVLDKAGRQLKQIENDLKGVQSKSSRMGEALREGTAQGEEGVNRLARSMKNLQKSAEGMKAAGEKIQSLGGQLTALGATMLGTAIFPIVQAANFEKGMKAVQSVMVGVTQNEMTAMAAKAKELGETTAFSASQAADGMYKLAQAGLDAAGAIETTGPSLMLAAAGELQLESATGILVNTLKSLQLPMSDADRVTDVLAKTASLATTSVSELGQAMSYAAPVAASAGISLEKTSAILGVLADRGLKATRGGTAFRKIINQLSSLTPKATKALANMHVELKKGEDGTLDYVEILRDMNEATESLGDAGKLDAFSQVFGKAFGGVAVAVAEAADTVDDYNSKLEDSAGAAKEMAEIRLEGLWGELVKLKSASEGLAIAVGEQLIPKLTELAKSLSDMIRDTAEWVRQNEGMVKTIGLWVVGLGAAFTALGALLVPFGLLIKVIGASAEGLLIFGRGIKAVVGFMGDLYALGYITFQRIVVGVTRAVGAMKALVLQSRLATIALRSVGWAAVAVGAVYTLDKILGIAKAFKEVKEEAEAARESIIKTDAMVRSRGNPKLFIDFVMPSADVIASMTETELDHLEAMAVGKLGAFTVKAQKEATDFAVDVGDKLAAFFAAGMTHGGEGIDAAWADLTMGLTATGEASEETKAELEKIKATLRSIRAQKDPTELLVSNLEIYEKRIKSTENNLKRFKQLQVDGQAFDPKALQSSKDLLKLLQERRQELLAILNTREDYNAALKTTKTLEVAALTEEQQKERRALLREMAALRISLAEDTAEKIKAQMDLELANFQDTANQELLTEGELARGRETIRKKFAIEIAEFELSQTEETMERERALRKAENDSLQTQADLEMEVNERLYDVGIRSLKEYQAEKKRLLEEENRRAVDAARERLAEEVRIGKERERIARIRADQPTASVSQIGDAKPQTTGVDVTVTPTVKPVAPVEAPKVEVEDPPPVPVPVELKIEPTVVDAEKPIQVPPFEVEQPEIITVEAPIILIPDITRVGEPVTFEPVTYEDPAPVEVTAPVTVTPDVEIETPTAELLTPALETPEPIGVVVPIEVSTEITEAEARGDFREAVLPKLESPEPITVAVPVEVTTRIVEDQDQVEILPPEVVTPDPIEVVIPVEVTTRPVESDDKVEVVPPEVAEPEPIDVVVPVQVTTEMVGTDEAVEVLPPEVAAPEPIDVEVPIRVEPNFLESDEVEVVPPEVATPDPVDVEVPIRVTTVIEGEEKAVEVLPPQVVAPDPIDVTVPVNVSTEVVNEGVVEVLPPEVADPDPIEVAIPVVMTTELAPGQEAVEVLPPEVVAPDEVSVTVPVLVTAEVSEAEPIAVLPPEVVTPEPVEVTVPVVVTAAVEAPDRVEAILPPEIVVPPPISVTVPVIVLTEVVSEVTPAEMLAPAIEPPKPVDIVAPIQVHTEIDRPPEPVLIDPPEVTPPKPIHVTVPIIVDTTTDGGAAAEIPDQDVKAIPAQEVEALVTVFTRVEYAEPGPVDIPQPEISLPEPVEATTRLPWTPSWNGRSIRSGFPSQMSRFPSPWRWRPRWWCLRMCRSPKPLRSFSRPPWRPQTPSRSRFRCSFPRRCPVPISPSTFCPQISSSPSRSR
jgi:TP901 family phage tail tape measure protein